MCIRLYTVTLFNVFKNKKYINIYLTKTLNSHDGYNITDRTLVMEVSNIVARAKPTYIRTCTTFESPLTIVPWMEHFVFYPSEHTVIRAHEVEVFVYFMNVLLTIDRACYKIDKISLLLKFCLSII